MRLKGLDLLYSDVSKAIYFNSTAECAFLSSLIFLAVCRKPEEKQRKRQEDQAGPLKTHNDWLKCSYVYGRL